VTPSEVFQLPFEDEVTCHTYALWGAVQVGNRASLSQNMAEWPLLEASPMALRLIPPTPAQQLRGEWQAHRRQWCLRATDGNGAKPTAQPTAWMWVRSARRASLGPVQGGLGNVWAGFWVPYLLEGGAPLSVSIWIAAPGYVTAQLTETVPGE
jgi:hypothetical protein